MSNTVIEKLEDLDFIIQDNIYLSGKPGADLDKEIFNNMWGFSFSEDCIEDITFSDLQNFLYIMNLSPFFPKGTMTKNHISAFPLKLYPNN